MKYHSWKSLYHSIFQGIQKDTYQPRNKFFTKNYRTPVLTPESRSQSLPSPPQRSKEEYETKIQTTKMKQSSVMSKRNIRKDCQKYWKSNTSAWQPYQNILRSALVPHSPQLTSISWKEKPIIFHSTSGTKTECRNFLEGDLKKQKKWEWRRNHTNFTQREQLVRQSWEKFSIVILCSEAFYLVGQKG